MVHCEKFVTDVNKDKFERAWEVTSRIRELAQQYPPDVIGFEGLAYAKNGNATRDLAGLLFTTVTILRYIDRYNVEVVAPTEVKKTAVKGNASKDELVEALPDEIRHEFDAIGVKKTTGLRDLSDAYWIGRTILKTTGK